MGDKSDIGWTGSTWNVLVGCTKKSAGCKNCYFMTVHDRRHLAWKSGTWPDAPKQYHYPSTVLQYLTDRMDLPLRWKRPRRIFVNSLSDLFHEDVPFSFIDEVWAVMEKCPQHTFQILTKRSDRMREYCRQAGVKVLPNVHLGVSVENSFVLSRVEDLIQTPAAVRFLSVEPMIGPVDVRAWLVPDNCDYVGETREEREANPLTRTIDWVICGGESGPGARPMHPDWARELRDQCLKAGVPFFFKQWGSWMPIDQPAKQDVVKPLRKNERWMNLAGGHGFHGDEVWRMRRTTPRHAGRLLDGVLHDEFPRPRPLTPTPLQEAANS